MNDIYIDANVENSFAKSESNSEFTYKLSEPLELPKGTNISIAQSFINKKGITGGSIEISDDIYERLTYVFYITEQAHFAPLANLSAGQFNKNWCRSTLKISGSSYLTNWDVEAWNGSDPDLNHWVDDTNKILYGESLMNGPAGKIGTVIGDGNHPGGQQWWIDQADKVNNASVFCDYGGNNMILPQVHWKRNTDNKFYLCPIEREMEIFIPKGIYGIGQLGQIVEDYFNGNIKVKTVNGIRSIDRTSDIQTKIDNANTTPTDPKERFDGQPLNRPTMDYTFVRQDRRFDYACGEEYKVKEGGNANLYDPVYTYTDVGMEGFTAMDCFNELLNFTQENGLPSDTANVGCRFNWTDLKDNISPPGGSAGDPPIPPGIDLNQYITFSDQAKRRPFYYFTTPEDEGKIQRTIDATHPVRRFRPAATLPIDSDTTEQLYGYNMYGYGIDQNDLSLSRVVDNDHIKKQLIGTTNFSFSYNTDSNGFEIKGLHQQIIAPSHDQMGTPNSSNGKQVINFKKIMGNSLRNTPIASVLGQNYYDDVSEQGTRGGFANRPAREKIVSQLNTPETRLGGMMIINWATETSSNNRTSTPNTGNQTDFGKRFDQYFTNEDDARKNWEKTIWFRLGFDYDQLQNPNTAYKKQSIYNKDFENKQYYGLDNANRDCGFTTNTSIDNTIIPTVAGQNNPINIAAKDSTSLNQAATSNYQIYGYNPIASPWDFPSSGGAKPGKSSISAISQYGNSLYNSCSIIPVAVGDVGGITASRLPTLSKQSYYLITSDILDNFKDNVKAGDPLALLGVVAKSNLSNQDFIVDKNQIVQTLSQSKIVNKIKIKILNPNLTQPNLDTASSIILKISRPNIIPTSLLAPKEMKLVESETNTL